MENKIFDTYVVITPKDFDRVKSQYLRLAANLPEGKLIFIGNDEVGRLSDELKKSCNRVEFINENDILDFDDVWGTFNDKLKDILRGEKMPRGGVGWYYQQFLKYELAYISEHEYYMTWDGDTIPCRRVNMFKDGTGEPFFDNKNEYHELYFDTMAKLIPGMKKVIRGSFISEHMIFNVETVKKLVSIIEVNDKLPGDTFWKKIISAIDPLDISKAAFSEFETYGTFVAMTKPSMYRLREWHSFRLGAEFFDLNTICDRDYEWLGRDFDAISFEKNQYVKPGNGNLFDNPKYQEKLSARKMLEVAQEEFNGGYMESWGRDGCISDPLS